MKGLLDTSIFISVEQHRPLERDQLPDEAAISVVTLAELGLGVHMAAGEAVRGRRLQTLMAAHSTYSALPIDDDVASAFAQLVASCRRGGTRLKVQDAWIAATAISRAVPLYTQDSDFDGLPGVEIVRV